MKNKTMRVGIIGTGWIAEKAAITLNGLDTVEAYAIASRSQEKAEAFADILSSNYIKTFKGITLRNSYYTCCP